MKVYLDVCCLSRLFDDQSQDKIRLETESIIGILKRCADSEWALIGSDILSLEISKNPDSIKRQKVSRLHEGADFMTKYNMEIKSRAGQFRKFGVKLFDSLHLASAEYADADVFLTTDINLIKAVARSDIKIRVANPLNFYMEVLNHE
jgi:hypothetical protein